jgi:guanosine-3',5'-bis(diphosphate) 3'-pyrophosphohydrolase
MNKEALVIIGRLKGLGFHLAIKAVYYAIDVHFGEKRDDKRTDYSEHPIRVCRTLLNLGVRDETTLTAGLLHDAVENGRATLDIIRVDFNEEVAYLVDNSTKREGESEESYYRRVRRDIRSIIIKASDRVCNVGDMIYVFPTDRLRSYKEHTEKYVLPMMKEARRTHPQYSDLFVLCRGTTLKEC